MNAIFHHAATRFIKSAPRMRADIFSGMILTTLCGAVQVEPSVTHGIGFAEIKGAPGWRNMDVFDIVDICGRCMQHDDKSWQSIFWYHNAENGDRTAIVRDMARYGKSGFAAWNLKTYSTCK